MCEHGGPYTKMINLERIEKLREKADPKRNQNRLLSDESLARYNWYGSSSTSDYPHNRPRIVRPEEVMVAAHMSYLVVHYRARTVVTVEVATTSIRSEVLWGVSVASTSGLHSSIPPLGHGEDRQRGLR